MEEMVRSALVTACLFAGSPTSLSPFLVNATTDGVVLIPSAFGITTGFPPSITATQLLVVPKSIPIIFPIFLLSFFYSKFDFLLYFMEKALLKAYSSVYTLLHLYSNFSSHRFFFTSILYLRPTSLPSPWSGELHFRGRYSLFANRQLRYLLPHLPLLPS